MFTATLIAAGRLTPNIVAAAQERLAAAGCAPTTTGWIDEGDAADLHFELAPRDARTALKHAFAAVDVIVQQRAGRRKMLLVADMDSTMITVECIDELADYAGLKPEIAAITERAMRGELDFAAALDARVALLRGLRANVIQQCLEQRVRLTPGATALVRTMRGWGATAILVSGGFTRFAEPVARAIGFDRAIANVLELDGDALAGTVAHPIVDATTKRTTLLDMRAALGLDDAATLAVGDGANDLAMIEVAGLGVAFRAKPIVAAAAAARIEHGDLTALLWAQGVRRADWAGLAA